MTLISKEDAMGVVQDHFNAHGFKGYYDGQKMMDRIAALPSAEAVEGEWIVTEHCSNEYGFRKWIEIECPFCGERPVHEGLNNMNFCPNCGAKMERREP